MASTVITPNQDALVSEIHVAAPAGKNLSGAHRPQAGYAVVEQSPTVRSSRSLSIHAKAVAGPMTRRRRS